MSVESGCAASIPRRICVVTTWFPTSLAPSSGIFVARDAQALAAAGHRVRVIHLAAPHLLGDDDAVGTPVLTGGYQLVRLPFAVGAGAGSAGVGGGRSASADQSAGMHRPADMHRPAGTHHPVDMHRPAGTHPLEPRDWPLPGAACVTPLRSVAGLPGRMVRVRRELERWTRGAEVVHTQAVSALLPWLVGRPEQAWVHTEHWSGFAGEAAGARALVPRVVSQLLRFPDVVVAVSEQLADQVSSVRRGRPLAVIPNQVHMGELVERRAEVLTSGAPTPASAPSAASSSFGEAAAPSSFGDAAAPSSPTGGSAPSTPLPSAPGVTAPSSPTGGSASSDAPQHLRTPLRLIGVGGLIERKNPLLALECAAQLCARGIPTALAWVGDGPLAEAMRERADARGVELTLHGTVPAEQVSELLSAADVFCVPTRAETFFLGAAEAIAAGRPVVTGAQGGHTTWLDPRVSSLVVGEDPREWADAVLDVLSRCRGLSAADIRATLPDSVRPDSLVHAYEEVYAQALASQEHAGRHDRASHQEHNGYHAQAVHHAQAVFQKPTGRRPHARGHASAGGHETENSKAERSHDDRH